MFNKNQTLVKVVFTLDEVIHYKLMWVQLKNKDLYWGFPDSSITINEGTKYSGKKVEEIVFSKNYFEKPKEIGKYSFHESGYTHYKSTNDKGETITEYHGKWELKDKIEEPYRFYAYLTKELKFYKNIEKKKFKKHKNEAVVIKVKPIHLNQRFYFEFFLAPKKIINIKDFPYNMIGANEGIFKIVIGSLGIKLNLCVKAGLITDMKGLDPKLSFALIPQNENSVLPLTEG